MQPKDLFRNERTVLTILTKGEGECQQARLSSVRCLSVSKRKKAVKKEPPAASQEALGRLARYCDAIHPESDGI
jgi:hypothetical protein